ncbi:hypothetical protein PACTADRAFT_50717 [Pachysolen tannophilus NRRL Y-2460]|uniref:Ribonuclease H2 subunit B n=1 Tax=Pachysolen tannophilus NRRL Y-2460 TaxID=669874 RepID=A0A1E4TSW1_PACTA|nr:hypothetical protein PACTADRAFT_50717 [Pachysolen tannophilus NRRL Y-2460]
MLNPIDPSTLKVIILPRGQEQDDLTSIELIHPRTLKPIFFLYNNKNNEIYELKNFNFTKNPHMSNTNSKKIVMTRNGEIIKSLLFDKPDNFKNSDGNGLIVENPDILLATRFNFVYMLLLYYEKQLESLENDSSFRLRLLNSDDLIEILEKNSAFKFNNFPNSFWSIENSILMNALNLIHDKIEENDEIYFRLNETKIIDMFDDKINKLSQSFPISILQKLINPKLSAPMTIQQKELLVLPTPPASKIPSESSTPKNIETIPSDQIPADIIEYAKINHSINILASYLSPLLVIKLRKKYDTKLTMLAQYKKQLDNMNEMREIAQNNLNALNENLHAEQENSKKRNNKNNNNNSTSNNFNKKRKILKKPVAPGKGALDNFFKAKK